MDRRWSARVDRGCAGLLGRGRLGLIGEGCSALVGTLTLSDLAPRHLEGEGAGRRVSTRRPSWSRLQLGGWPLGAAAGTAGDEVQHFLLDPTDRSATDADRLREAGLGHQGVDGRAGQRGRPGYVAQREESWASRLWRPHGDAVGLWSVCMAGVLLDLAGLPRAACQRFGGQRTTRPCKLLYISSLPTESP